LRVASQILLILRSAGTARLEGRRMAIQAGDER
jgi:hypothetical protein